MQPKMWHRFTHHAKAKDYILQFEESNIFFQLLYQG